jgi:cytochrome c6
VNACTLAAASAGAPTRWGIGALRAAALCGAGLAALVLALAASPGFAADIIKGSQIYAKHCTGCHGPAGMSVMPGAPHLARGERMMQSDLALLASLKAGKNAMPAYFGILTEREILDVIAYSRTLRQ